MYRIKSAHSESLGGVMKIHHDTIFDVNGFPNYIWGWGIEDRALYHRCRIKNILIQDNNLKTFNVQTHKSNAEKYTGVKKKISDIWTYGYIEKLSDTEKQELIMNSGLNNLQYTILNKKCIHPNIEIYLVEI